MDISDQIQVGKKSKIKLKQFWPEYSQTSYESALSKQKCFGNYTEESKARKLRVSAKQREGIIVLITELHK